MKQPRRRSAGNVPTWWEGASRITRTLYVAGTLTFVIGLGVVVALLKPYPGASHYWLRAAAFLGILTGLGMLLNRLRRQ